MQNLDFLLCTRLQSSSCHLATLLQLSLQLICQAELSSLAIRLVMACAKAVRGALLLKTLDGVNSSKAFSVT